MPGSLLHDGRRIVVGPGGVRIGRGDDSDLVIPRERASRRHARIYEDAGGFWLEDLGSRHGTFLNGERLQGAPRALSSGDTISVADELVRFVGGEATMMASRQLPIVGTQTVAFEGERLAIGRDAANDVVLGDPNVSRFHAEARLGDDQTVEIVDLGSRNGTRVDGELVERATLSAGSTLGIGPFQLVFDGTTFLARDDHGALRLDAEGLTIDVKDKRILDATTLSIAPGEFTAIIGESGAGKSTLIKALAGVTTPSSGRVLINGEPVATRLTDLGYVPQDEIVHGLLSVTEALGYAARLRLPQDASREEIGATIERVLDELTLTEQAETRIGSLSGGQRKRTGVATELLNRPSLLFLDEPTTGLDPGLETRMMSLLRRLADNSRAVVVVTHATKNLALCDKVVVMGRGGNLAFHGTPENALAFFGVDTYDDIYSALEEGGAVEWRRRFESGRNGRATAGSLEAPAQAPATRRPRRQRRRLPQATVLAHRYLQLLLRDRRNMALLLGQVPVLALAIVGLFHSGLFDRPGTPGDAVQLLFLLATTVIWLGSIDASREVIKERSVFERETAVGTRVSAYLTSKLLVLFGLAAVQTVLLTIIVFAFQPLHEPFGAYLAVIGLLVLTSWVAVGMGLLVSATVGSQDQATSFIPLVLIPQLLFAGAIVTVQSMGEPVQTLSNAVFSRWALAGIGSTIDMDARIAEDPVLAQANTFGDFFGLDPLAGAGLLAGFLVLFVAWVALLLRRPPGR